MVAEPQQKKVWVNPNLITLKCALFAFFGGLGCIFPFLPLHMLALGLDRHESRLASIFSALISLIGPLLACFLADRWIYRKKGAQYGKYIRVLAAIFILLGAIIYGCLLALPTLKRLPGRQPQVQFACDAGGATVFHERCFDDGSGCHRWRSEQRGSLVLANCSYTCQHQRQLPRHYDKLYQAWAANAERSTTAASAETEQYDEYDDAVVAGGETERPNRGGRGRRQQTDREGDRVYVEPPHLCLKRQEKPDLCYVYTDYTPYIKVQATLQSTSDAEGEEDLYPDWCRYPLEGFQCNIPVAQARWMKEQKNESCIPVVVCQVKDPYDASGSVLADAQCLKVIGDEDATVWGYLVLRCIADIFPLAAVVLLDTAVIIATRETSTGRGDVGHQLAWGSLGWAIFAPLVAIGFDAVEDVPYLVPIVVGIILLAISALILLFSRQMPLTPPEWWWHTKIGMLAIPLSAIRKYGPEVIALGFVSVLLGMFWSAVDSYQPWHLEALYRNASYEKETLVGVVNLTALNETMNGHLNVAGLNDTLNGMLTLTEAGDTHKGVLDIAAFNETREGRLNVEELNETLSGLLNVKNHLSGVFGDSESLELNVITGLTLTITALPGILVLWFAERIVDYAGHNNILIGAFAVYVIRFTILGAIVEPWTVLFAEALEYFTLSLSWVTLVLYMRHLVPRRLIATGQAVPVIGHFCLGRLYGALIGLAQTKDLLDSLRCTYMILAIAAAFCGALYFLLYHFWLAPKCIPATVPPPPQTTQGGSAVNGGANGNYTPLRVYHDGKARKGHFRY